jgi:predicted PurR-regulated permease PerM
MNSDSAAGEAARGVAEAAVSSRDAPEHIEAVPPSAENAGDASTAVPRTPVEIAVILIAVVAVVATAHFAQAFLVPVVVGILLSYMLTPLVSQLERWRVPRLAGSALVILVLVSLVSATVYTIRDDVNRAVAELPGAARKLRYAAAESERKAPGPMKQLKEAAVELDKAAAEASGTPQPAATQAPQTSGVAAQFQSFVTEQSGHALAVMTQLAVALLLAFFLLAAGDTFRRKLARLAGTSLTRRRVTVEVLNRIDDQIQAYLLTILIANVLIALATWGSLALLGLPNPGMWGAITGVLHVIPYAGTVVAAAAVGVAAFLHTGGLGQAMLAMGIMVAIAVVIGMGVMTWMQGRAARMSPVAVFIGVLFFGWLWGGWGLLLGMPMLAVLKSVADRVEGMRPISELLGD